MQCEFVIERNVPIPDKRNGGGTRAVKYPFAALEVGNSFAVPLGEDKIGENYANAVRLRSAASNFKKRSGIRGLEFTVRTIFDEKVVRIWRIS